MTGMWVGVRAGGEGSGLRAGTRSALVGLDVVHSLPRGDLGESLAGAPQLPCDLARTHLRRVEEEEERRRRSRGGGGGSRIRGRVGGKKSVKSKEMEGRKKKEGCDL